MLMSSGGTDPDPGLNLSVGFESRAVRTLNVSIGERILESSLIGRRGLLRGFASRLLKALALSSAADRASSSREENLRSSMSGYLERDDTGAIMMTRLELKAPRAILWSVRRSRVVHRWGRGGTGRVRL